MEPIALKKSCDSCTNSKVKCSGGHPCERCVAKSLQCYYSPRKRRAKPKKVRKTSSSVSAVNGLLSVAFDPKEPMGSLMEWERRSWSVFFTLYKHYGTSCSLHWFNRQLNKMRKYLSRQGNSESLKRLTTWMDALNIDIDALAAQVERCRVKRYAMKNALALRVSGSVEEKKSVRNQANLEQTSEKVPFLKLITDYPGDLRDEKDQVVVECNSAFSAVFGISQQALVEQLNWTGGGFLPWGGDLLARILTKEKDLLAFVQILAIKFNTLAKPSQFPTVRDVPSCHMFEVNIKEKSSSGVLIPVNALIKCMHREILTVERCAMEISMEIIPLAPHDHLLEQDRFGDVTLLNIPKEVIPFSTKTDALENRRKRPFEDDEPDFVDGNTVSDLYSEPTQLPFTSPVNRMDSFDAEIKDILGDANPSNNILPAASMNSSFADTTRSVGVEDSILQQGLQEFASNEEIRESRPVNDGNLFEEQTDWLDGLLDWSSKQELLSLPVHDHS